MDISIAAWPFIDPATPLSACSAAYAGAPHEQKLLELLCSIVFGPTDSRACWDVVQVVPLLSAVAVLGMARCWRLWKSTRG